MIQTLRDKLAEMGKSCCEHPSLDYSEEGKGVILKPNSRAEAIKVKVDGCLITKGTKCDCLYFYELSSKRQAFLVELKGTDFPHALEQLAATKAHSNYQKLLNAVKPCKEKAVAIVGEKAKTNRPRKEVWEEENNIRLEIVPLERGKTHELKV